MSQENVEFVEGLLGGAAAMDKQAILAALPELIAQACASDIEWVEDPQRADGRVYHGREGVKQAFERWLEQWDEYGYEAERYVDCGDEVLVVSREHGRGITSGASVSSRIYSVWAIRAGKIARYQEFYDEQTALEAVGLAEEAMSQENVEIVRRWWASLEAGELPLDLTDENVRIDNIEQPVVQGAFHGHDGLRSWWQDFTEALADIHHEVLDSTALDAERVLAEIRSQGQFRETGLPIDLRWASIFSLRNGKVVRAAGYLSARDALKAVGLAE